MIKSLLLILLSTGYISATLSGKTFPDRAACMVEVGKKDKEIKKLIENYNKTMRSNFLGKSDGTYSEVCVTRPEYISIDRMLKEHNQPVIDEMRRKMGRQTDA